MLGVTNLNQWDIGIVGSSFVVVPPAIPALLISHMLRRKPITAKRIDAILPFLDAFESMAIKRGESSIASSVTSYEGSESVEAFVLALYSEGWIEQFDWEKWQETAAQYVDSPDLLASIDAETIRKLLTTHVRKDQSYEGHLAAMFENGHIVALLRRLKEIRAETNYNLRRRKPR